MEKLTVELAAIGEIQNTPPPALAQILKKVKETLQPVKPIPPVP